MLEGQTSSSGLMPGWVAADLDEGGENNDSLVYNLEGAVNGQIRRAGGAIALVVHTDTNGVLGDSRATAIELRGTKLNYESGQSAFTIYLEVSDKWVDEPVRVPIAVTLEDINELEISAKKPIQDQNLINGSVKTFNLDDIFSDPEGDQIEYSAYTNLYKDVLSIDEENVLTVRGANAEPDTPSSVTATVIATDGEITLSAEFEITTRYKNDPPKISILETGTIIVGSGIYEADSANKLLLPLIEYTDDDPGPTAVFNGEPLFKVVFDPHVSNGDLCKAGTAGCVEQTNKLAIVVGKNDLNYEASSLHRLSLALRDSWDETVVSDPLEFQVAVFDNNDAPTVVSGISIENQTTVVNGYGSYDASHLFADEDGDRLRVFAESGDELVATATVSGLDFVTFNGIGEGSTNVTLTATDPDGESASTSFKLTVGKNNMPVVAEDVLMARLPTDNTINVGATADILLDGLFSDPDHGDMVTSITASISNEAVLLVVPTNNGDTATLVGRSSGVATLTISAMDLAGNTTSVDSEITVNVAPSAVNPLDPVTLNRTTPAVVDISDLFSDGDDGDESLTITAEPIGDSEDRVKVEISDGMLTIVGVMLGDAEILLKATDPHGAKAKSILTATVVNVGPTVAMSLDAQEMDRTAPLTLDLSGLFVDDDGESMVIAAEVEDPTVIEVGAFDEHGTLTLIALAVGGSAVILTAADEDGADVSIMFDVTVNNVAPVVAEAVTDQSATRVEDVILDIGATFDDPDADNHELTITVTVGNETYVSALLHGSILTISGRDVGVSNITLTANDADGGTAETQFTTTIENIAPVIANSISPISIEVGGEAASQSISGLFIDEDELSYSITSEDSLVASASLTGMTAIIAPMSRGSTTVTVTAKDPHGGEAMVVGSVIVGDSQLKAVAANSLAGFGRAMLASVSSSIGSRIATNDHSSDLTLDAWMPVEEQNAMLAMSPERRGEIALNVIDSTNTKMSDRSTPTSRGSYMTGLEAFQSMVGRRFALNLGTSEDRSNWSVWGDIDRQSYEGEGYHGLASNIYLGADVTVAQDWMFGVAVSSNTGNSDYTWGTATQSMEMRLTTVLPYLSYQPNSGTSLWGVAGYGSGELDTSVVGATNDISELAAKLTLVGGTQDLTKVGRLNLELRGDAAMTSLKTERGSGAADGITSDIHRIRVGLEGSFITESRWLGTFEPFGQFSLRSDGGDGSTGTGIELAGGLRLTSRAFSLEVQGRSLAMHGDANYSESGFSLMAKLNPTASPTGIAVTIAPRWGADAVSNGILWQDRLNMPQSYGVLTGFNNDGASSSINAQIGYGMLVGNERYLLTPFLDLRVSDRHRRETLIGASLQQMNQNDTALDIDLVVGDVRENLGTMSSKVGLNATLQF